MTIGWDIGGAHVKACLVQGGQVQAVAQWPCALWQGLGRLDAVLHQAAQRWPLRTLAHAATMTGEMVDLFPHRADGVAQLAERLAAALGPRLRLYAGTLGWLPPAQAAQHWRQVASANWRLSAEWVAQRLPQALLVDLGSTTCDLVPVHGHAVVAQGHDDASRLASGELVYQGVVRTPLCALGPRAPVAGVDANLMNEWFASSADVYRLTGELDEAHDQHPAADSGPKTRNASLRRLARMVGRDAQDQDGATWLALARHFRQRQLDMLAGEAQRVAHRAGLGPDAPLVAAGCGAFLVPALAAALGRPWLAFAALALPAEHSATATAAHSALAGWAQVCAPAVAAALLAPQG